MSPLLKKEIRLLLPSAIICCALGLTNFLFTFNNDGSLQYLWGFLLAFVFCGAMAVMLALNSFGAEISSGTFSNLLAQPVSRQKIWDTKILLLAASLLVLGIFWSGCGIIRLKMIGHDLNLLDLFTEVGTFGLVVFSGGLWTVLLLRQVAAAFWFTVLVPSVLLVIIVGLSADHSSEFVEGMTVSVLGVYSLAGYFFARWLFFRAQDIQWSGGAITMPEMRGLARFKIGSGARRLWRPRMALFVKELQLHQAQFLIAGVLAVLHFGVLATRHFGHFRKNSDTEFVLEIFWGLWLVMPFLVGCAAVAEERKLGTLEGQLCLPVKRRTQFLNKFMVVILLSVALGAAMPWLLEGNRILPDFHFEKVVNGIALVDSYNRGNNFGYYFASTGGLIWLTVINLLVSLSPFLPFLLMAAICAGIAAIAFYASTLTRNTPQALAPAVAGIALAWFLILAATIPGQFDIDYLWHGPLPYFIVFPALALTLLALAYSNFQHVLTGWKLGGRNLLVLASVFALTVALTSAIYHRAWEKFTPFEPPHGPARLTLTNPTSLDYGGGQFFARLPDGRIWMADQRSSSRLSLALGNFKESLANGEFFSGSNWLSINRSRSEYVGIKSDGTLWISEQQETLSQQQSRWKINEDELHHMVPFGTETNWNSLLPAVVGVFLTKTDGTLWYWGPTNFRLDRSKAAQGLRAFTPERWGTDSNWAEVFQKNYQSGFCKTDGSIWALRSSATNGQPPLPDIRSEYTLVKTSDHQADARFRSTVMIYYGLAYQLGIRDDGTFRIWEDQLPNPKSPYFEWSPVDLQIGTDTNWLAVAGGGNKVVTLKNDGTLWLWNFHLRNLNGFLEAARLEPEIQATMPVRLGTHSDWIAITGNSDSIIALAADGSLWYWPLAQPTGIIAFGPDQRIPRLLDNSHKPQFLGNIFGKSD